MQDPDSARELEDTLANLRFVHDPTTDELVDSLGVLWRRPGAAAGDRADERGTPVDPPEGVRQMVDAINSKDTDAFLDAFAPDGAFSPRGQFAETSSLFDNHQPVAEVDLVDAWMTIVDAWGLEAELTSCTSLPVSAANVADQVDAIVECQVATRWRTLSMEITEAWVFEVGDAEVRWWNSMSCCRNDLDLVELNPPDRSLPLGYAGLEAWEAWLDANHPEDAARFLNPRATSEADCDGCAEALASLAPGDPERADRLAPLVGVVDDGWVVDGHQFTPIGLIPYDPAFADEISASIREYLEKR